MKKIIVLALCGLSMAIPSSAQFGKLKGLVSKDKAEKPEAKGAAESAAPDKSEASSPTDKVSVSPQAWSLSFDGNIDWFRLSPTGKVIASTNSALYGVEPATGKVAWKHEFLKNLSTENYNPISGSPYIAIVTGGMMNMQQVILDVSSGKIVADTKEMGMKMVNKRFTVPSLGGILFAGYLNNAPSLVFVDAASGARKWVLSKVFESASEMLVAKPLAVEGNSLLLATGKRLYKIDVANGNVAWNVDYKTVTDKGTLATETAEEVDDKASTQAGEGKGGGGLLGSAGGLGKVPGLGGLGKATGAASAAGKMGAMGSGMREGMAQSADAVFGKFLVLDQHPNLVYYYTNDDIAAFDLATGKAVWPTVKLSDPLAGLLFDARGFVVTTNDKKAIR